MGIVVDVDVCAPIVDHAEFLKRGGDRTHAAALHAHHLHEKLLRKRQIIAKALEKVGVEVRAEWGSGG